MESNGFGAEPDAGRETPQSPTQTADEARRSLDLLKTTRHATEIEGALPLTPLWYGAALATTIAASGLYGHFEHWLWLVATITAIAVMSMHYVRTVKVHPRRSRRSVTTNLIVFFICWMVLAAWGVFTSTRADEPGFATLAFGAWLATTLALVGAIALMNRWHQHSLAR